MTYTYAILRVSQQTYDEIRQKLAEAGYQHAFHPSTTAESDVIDMRGIGLCASPADPTPRYAVTIEGREVPAENLEQTVNCIRDAVEAGRMTLQDGRQEIVRLAQLSWPRALKDRS